MFDHTRFNKSKHSLFLLILLCVNLYFCRVSAFKRIVNGVDADQNEFKFMVSLQRNGTHFCGGTILDEEHILTAAHCVCNQEWNVIELLKVKFTSLKLDDPNATSLPIQNVVCNDYDILELIKDVAILRLQEKIPASLFEPVKLPPVDFSTTLPLHGVVIGWGLTRTDGTSSNILQKIDVVVYNDAICSQSYSGIRNIEHQICSGWPTSDRGSCQGDSGGPLLVNDTQIGIISFGDASDCTTSGMEKPKVAARVTAYLDWIDEVVKIDKSTSTVSNEVEISTQKGVVDDGASTSNQSQNFRSTTQNLREISSSSHKLVFLGTYFYFGLGLQYLAVN